MTSNLALSIANLTVLFRNQYRVFEIIKRANFSIKQNEFLFLIGRNGSGKTTLCLALTNLLDRSFFELSGEILFNGVNIINADNRTIENIRKEHIGYILQNPFASFDPLLKIKNQFIEISELKKIPLKKFYQLMEIFELEKSSLEKYPFELSGGMLQRLSIVRAFACDYKIIISDEPTSALDKPTSNIVMNYLRNYVDERKGSILFVTQDILLAKKYADRIGFLSGGQMQVYENLNEIFYKISNPEITALIHSLKELTE